MKHFLTTISILLCALTGFSQKNGSITGVLIDSANQKNTIGYATVSLYKEADSALVTYKLSDEKGIFKLTNLEHNIKYRMVITAWQYKVYRKEIWIDPAATEVNLGNLLLEAKENSIDEVEIRAERPPIIVRNDTVEFNAESFKTLPTAVAEDLLKKLPGVAIDQNGGMLYNGKSVSKILVDGKEFFGGDPQIATKNLPANIIDKVQVSDDIEAKRRDPDLLPANTPQVINLKLKRAIKQGAFGKLYAGSGLKGYYEAGGLMNFFRDTTQVSVLAYGNNINKPAFSMGDMQKLGGFNRSGFNSIMISSDGGFAFDNISFGGLGSGVQRSGGGGVNFNTVTKSGIKINSKYFFGQNNAFTEQLINENQMLGSQRLITNSNINNRNIVNTHNISAKIEWKIDSLTRLTFNPRVTLSNTNFRGGVDKSSADEANQLINTALTNTYKKGDNQQYYVSADLWKDFKKRGRSFNINMNASKNSVLDQNFNNSSSYFYNGNIGSDIYQLRDNAVRTSGVYMSANYSDPINKKLTLSLTVNGNYLNNENALSTFYKNPANQDYDIAVPSLSETVGQSGIKSTARARLRWTLNKDWSIQPAMVFNAINLKNEFVNYTDFEQKYNFFFPSLNIRYKVFSLDYTPSFEEPSVQYIQPVSNNTDPLFIQNGNAGLLPAKIHRLTFNIYKYDVKNAINYNVYSYGSLMNNGVIMSRIINPDGVQISTPVNADGIYQIYGNASISKDFKNSNRQFNVSVGLSGGYSKNPIAVNNFKSTSTSLSISPRLGARINLNDKFEFNQNYSFNTNKTKYDDVFFSDRKTLSHNIETEIVVRYPKKLVFETSFRMQINDQNIVGYNNTIKLWNAGITYLFMKNDRAQLKFSVNDILQSNVKRYLSISENFIRDTQTNNIGRYALLSLTYNIQNFGEKVGGKQSFFGF